MSTQTEWKEDLTSEGGQSGHSCMGPWNCLLPSVLLGAAEEQ